MAIRTRDDAAKVLMSAVGEKQFFSVDGCIIQDLDQLAICLSHLSDDRYMYHVNSSKNDFSSWVRDVTGDEKLAHDLAKAENRVQAAMQVQHRVAWLKAKALK